MQCMRFHADAVGDYVLHILRFGLRLRFFFIFHLVFAAWNIRWNTNDNLLKYS